MNAFFDGDLTGATFSFDLARPRTDAGWGERFDGRGAGGETVYVHRLDTLAGGFGGDMQRARAAIALAQSEAVRNCPALVQLIDFHFETIDDGFGERYDLLTSAWEWAESTLRETIDGGVSDPARLAKDVEASVGAALACLHAADVVHSDVAPNNILLVAGSWKLADLNVCVRNGEPIIGLPPARYVANGVALGDAADASIDRYALSASLDEIRACSA